MSSNKWTVGPGRGDPVTPGFEVSFELVTPELAAEWLAINRLDNRRVNPIRVARYAGELKAGAWGLSHQGIAMDDKGRLMDGQHRLTAIVETGISAPMMVCRKVSGGLFPVIDGGAARGASQFLTGKYATMRAAMARFLMKVEEDGGVAHLGTITTGTYTARAILDWLEVNDQVSDYGENYAKMASAAAASRKFQSATPAALLTAGYFVGPSKWDNWWDDVHALHSGSGVPDGNPLKALYSAAPASGGAQWTRVAVMRAFRVALAYRDGQPMHVVRRNMYDTVRFW